MAPSFQRRGDLLIPGQYHLPRASDIKEQVDYWDEREASGGLGADEGQVIQTVRDRLQLTREVRKSYDSLFGPLSFDDGTLEEFQIVASSALAASRFLRQPVVQEATERNVPTANPEELSSCFDPGGRALLWHVRRGQEALLLGEHTRNPDDPSEVWLADTPLFLHTRVPAKPTENFCLSYGEAYPESDGSPKEFPKEEYLTVEPVYDRRSMEPAAARIVIIPL